MRRLVADRLGDFDAFRIESVPVPAPRSGEALVRVGAAAAGFVDGLIAEGRYQIRPPVPFVPGGEIAGSVEAVGIDVSTVAPGDRVATWQLGGGFADYVLVPAAELDPLPSGLSLVTAAAALVDYQTARYALERGNLKVGETILVLGANGGVGAAAARFARGMGARVIAAVSNPKGRERAHAGGAAEAVGSSAAGLRDELRDKGLYGALDVVFDPVGGDLLEPAFRALAKEGRHLVIGFAGGRISALPANLPLLKSASLVGVDIRHHIATAPATAAATRSMIFAGLAAGEIEPPAIELYPLDRAKEALAATMRRGKTGKIVVQP